jgi:hypothetical protein
MQGKSANHSTAMSSDVTYDHQDEHDMNDIWIWKLKIVYLELTLCMSVYFCYLTCLYQIQRVFSVRWY